MPRIGRLAQLIGVNTIPVAGVFWGDWSDATAIAFYWCETALVVFFVALRLVIHRRVTRKRGHYVETRTSRNHGPWKIGVTTYNVAFLTTATAFSIGNLIFLLVLLGLFTDNVGGGVIDLNALKQGLLIALLFVGIGFAIDIPGMAARPFAWVRLMAEGALWRVFVIYIAIFIGVFCAVVLDRPHAMFGVFFSLKLFTDVASNFKQWDPVDPPRWTRVFYKKDWEKFQAEWRTEREARLASEAADEKVYEGRPSSTPPNVGLQPRSRRTERVR